MKTEEEIREMLKSYEYLNANTLDIKIACACGIKIQILKWVLEEE